MKFEEDLIINNVETNDMDIEFYENQDQDQELTDEYYYEQLLEDLALEIKEEMQDYCHDMGLQMCEYLNIQNLYKLIKNE